MSFLRSKFRVCGFIQGYRGRSEINKLGVIENVTAGNLSAIDTPWKDGEIWREIAVAVASKRAWSSGNF